MMLCGFHMIFDGFHVILYGHFRQLIVRCVLITCGVYAGVSAVGFFQINRIVYDPKFHVNLHGGDTILIQIANGLCNMLSPHY